jgi:ankyrin repeat protein
LYYNASIDQKSDEGITPLMASIMAGHAHVADLLIQNGANMETRNNDGFTPFLMASLNGDTLIMDLLYKHHVDIYTTNKARYNALDLAISANQAEAVTYLLKIGSKWGNSSDNAVNPYTVASKYRRKDLLIVMKNNSVPGHVMYGIDQASVTLSSRFTTKDYYTGFSMSFKEPFLNGGIIAGTDMKLWYTRVLIKNTENLFHQYHDKGYLAYAGLFKDFTLYEKPFKYNILLSTTLKAGYSFGHTMKGTELAPANEFLLIPDVSVKWEIKSFSISTGLEYVKSQFYRIGPLWFRLGFSYTLFFDKIRTEVKPIKWY